MNKIFSIIVLVLFIAGIGFVLKLPREQNRTPEEIQKMDLIRLDSPRPNQTIKSPLVVRGEARGFWFFEANFPVMLVDWDGRIIATGIAKAQSDWMTEKFVPFEATLNFKVDKDVYSNRGALILKRDNPSDLPQNDNALEIPILFEQ